MRWRWLLFDYVDPELPFTLRQRIGFALWPGQVWIWRMPARLRWRRIIWGIGLMAWILGARFVVWLIDLLGVPLLLGGLACILVMWLFLCVSYGVLCREEVFCFLRRKGFNVCSRCGYWLRELPDDIAKCPECGTQREPMPPMTAL